MEKEPGMKVGHFDSFWTDNGDDRFVTFHVPFVSLDLVRRGSQHERGTYQRRRRYRRGQRFLPPTTTGWFTYSYFVWIWIVI